MTGRSISGGIMASSASLAVCHQQATSDGLSRLTQQHEEHDSLHDGVAQTLPGSLQGMVSCMASSNQTLIPSPSTPHSPILFQTLHSL
ncbi:uncharacterized protein BO72DRAFT_446139 [Aspergillus fijiensis CBS 313.89]|uniref:Uncharacterized protein n=1 Tax=Aspergillus fijiensis CBS 313.89 TaxID=1448319 RepID=A0A8G1W151_9EURO|nr:uncharacterized protein BO72DRAFT_446139 [Aspergillus fijiensis CBS 313.89]RAK79308.1 hypothetical protein BO72DRAFT_446139 [Aspergillus fijiensis CBS 313.89]